MIVNGKTIFEITTYKNILVEKTILGLKIPEEVPVYHNFNYDNLIGIAKLWKQGSRKIIADISLFAPIHGFPAIAYIDGTKTVYALSIGGMQNKDKTIAPIV